MNKLFGSLLVMALVLSIAAVAIPVKAAVVGTLEVSSPYFYKDAILQVKLYDPDLIGSENVTISYSIDGGAPKSLVLYSPLRNGEFFGYFADSSVTTLSLANPPYGGDFSGYFVKESLTEGNKITFTYMDSSPVGTVTASAIYKPYTAELVSIDRTEYPMFGYIRILIRDYDYNLDPTAKDSVTATFNFYNVTGNNIASILISGTETEVSSGVFTFEIPYTTNTSIFNPTGAANLTGVTSGSPIKVEYSYDGDTVSRWIILKTFPISLMVEPSFTTYGDLVIRISDPNLNLKSWEKETISQYFANTNITVKIGNDIEKFDANVKETDVNTGVFEYKVPVVIGTANPTDGKLQVEVGQTKAEVKYYFNGSLKAETISTLSTTPASITSDKDMYKADAKVKLTLTAPDLNDDTVNINFFQISIPGGNATIQDINATMGEQTVGKLTIKVNGLLARGKDPQTLIFIETGENTGVFTASLDLSKIYNNANETLKNGDIVDVSYYDCINKVTTSVRFTIGVAAASISLDRDTYPLPYEGNVKVYITVKDSEANKSPTTIESGTAYLDVYNYTGGLVKSNSVPLTETGPDTGIFSGSIVLDNTTVVNTNDPALINGWIIAKYVDPASGKNITYTARFVATDASISVDKTSVKAGDKLEITVIDPDRNIDSKTKDSVTVNVEIDGITPPQPITLTETDVNTGVFKATITIGSGDYIVRPGKTIKFTYSDKTPSYITPATGYVTVTRTTSVKFATHTGTLSIDKTEYGLGSTMTVTLIDPDLNTDITSIQSINVTLRVPGYPDTPIKLTEENVSSSVFTGSYTWSATDTGLIGKTFQIIYRDDADATGKVAFAIVTGTIKSWDAEISFDKAYYNIGDMIEITVKDPDANRDPSIIEQITVQVMSTSDPIGQTITCVETGANTGIFKGRIQIVSAYETGKLYVKIGDTITVQYKDDLPADYAITGKSKTFTATAIVGVPIERPVPASAQKFVDPVTGAEKVSGKVGETIMLQASVKNVDVVDRPFTAIFKVKDAAGVTIFISWITGTLAPGQELSPAVSWTPGMAGSYTIEVLVIKSIAEPTPFSDTISKTFTVTG
ncbi:MAG: hypothetical protein QXI57_05820 [Candidatus Methanomethylicaceae archaeon]